MSFARSGFRYLAVVATAFLISSCASSTPVASHNDRSLQTHTEELAASLFSTHSRRSVAPRRIAVGSLVPVQDLRQQGDGQDRVMVQQIQEGLIGAVTQRGAQVIEYRTSQQLRLEDNQELMLSRELQELSTRQHLDYFLTGTYSEVSGGLLVNIRLVALADNSVHSAATHFFPWSALHGSGQQSELRQGRLYREAVPAEAAQARTQRHRTMFNQGARR
ncbi:FlgO family outer membrane protein [Aliidiomarina soli]|uniref:FlgO domain-containing protein n=1 Tax=Aliidiomarina soli TaxID=1928574 RepID=A0A432WC70_9GAMM|nr:FlgO family outer membrane protein [Aliidiomarina soli]RUO29646.1 hypothetical protein CWE14_14410 [Aliidiomarina soli]